MEVRDFFYNCQITQYNIVFGIKVKCFHMNEWLIQFFDGCI